MIAGSTQKNYPVDMAMDDRPQARGGFADRRPSDHDLITSILHPMISRQQQQQGFDVAGGGFVHLADVYYAAPEMLAERYAPAPGSRTCWYFLCPARCRYRAAAAGALGEGRWSSETGEVSPVSGADGRRVGHSCTLSYSYGGGARTTPPPWTTVTRQGWRMVELALDGGGDFVMCKLFRWPQNEASSSPTAVAVAARSAVPAPLFDCKRKAIGNHTDQAPPTVRQKLLMQQHSF